MYIHNFATLQKFIKLPKIAGSVLIEAMAAVAMTGLSIAALTRLEFRGKAAEKEINNLLLRELQNDSLTKGHCSETLAFENLKLSACGNGKHKKYYISGFSTLELAVSLAVLMPCLLSLALLMNLSAGSLKLNKAEKIRIYNTIRINQLLNEISREIDSHPFEIIPKIHVKSKIRFSDGKLNPVVNLAGENRPDFNSDAISYLRLNVPETMEILTNTPYIFACPRYKIKTDYKLYKTFMSLGPEGFYEGTMVWEEENDANGKTCIKGSFAVSQSLIGNSPHLFNQEHIRYLIPVERLYTLYLDRKKTLRYLGHRGNLNIENQPVIEKSPVLKFKIARLSSGIIHLGATLISGKKRQIINLNNKLARSDYLNFLLNRT